MALDSANAALAAAAISILIVEDQALVRAGMRSLIQVCDPAARIVEAGGCEEAWRLVSAEAFDVVFLDIDLREAVTGLDLLARIRSAGMPSRVVMLSAHSDEATVLNAIRAGAAGYICKDMEDRGLFRRALDTILAGGVFLPPEIVGAGAGLGRSPDPGRALAELGVRGRTAEALYHLCQGHSNAVIAHRMGVAESTVANEYNTRLFRAFRVPNRAKLIVEVARRGINPPPPPAP